MSFCKVERSLGLRIPVCLHWASIRLLPKRQQDVRGSLHPASCKRRENRVFVVAVREGRG